MSQLLLPKGRTSRQVREVAHSDPLDAAAPSENEILGSKTSRLDMDESEHTLLPLGASTPTSGRFMVSSY
jgi:hypothetical protein